LFENHFLKKFLYDAMLGANYYGAKLGAVIIGAVVIGVKLFATQAPRLRRCQPGQGPWHQMRWCQDV
jgi:hypothetical protein